MNTPTPTTTTIVTEQDKAKRISTERVRTNLFRPLEQPTIAFLCKIMPPWISPGMLTAIGLMGSVIAFAGLALAPQNVNYLLLSIVGFAVQWFGDSLDGRIAYYRNIPRKWYGFSLDLSVDWMSTVLMGLGFYIYLQGDYKLIAYIFVALYGWTITLTLLKYKMNDVYKIDIGLLGPTELRIIICLVLLVELFFVGSIKTFAIVSCVILVVTNTIDFFTVLQIGNARDRVENEKRQATNRK